MEQLKPQMLRKMAGMRSGTNVTKRDQNLYLSCQENRSQHSSVGATYGWNTVRLRADMDQAL
jgi:hypothetical protein